MDASGDAAASSTPENIPESQELTSSRKPEQKQKDEREEMDYFIAELKRIQALTEMPLAQKRMDK